MTGRPRGADLTAMRAMVLDKPGQPLVMRERPTPAPGVGEELVDVGLFTPAASHAASIREYGSGNGPPNPELIIAMSNVKETIYTPL